jgi:hypothetical protein
MTSKGKRSETLQLHANAVPSHTNDISANHGANHGPNHDDIRRRAYEISLERGGLPGQELEDWLQAEREIATAAAFMRAAIGEKQRP